MMTLRDGHCSASQSIVYRKQRCRLVTEDSNYVLYKLVVTVFRPIMAERRFVKRLEPCVRTSGFLAIGWRS